MNHFNRTLTLTASSANDQILSLESSGRALVLSSRGLERVEMNSDVVKEFFDNHDNVNKEKLRALQIIAPDKLFVKGTSGESWRGENEVWSGIGTEAVDIS